VGTIQVEALSKGKERLDPCAGDVGELQAFLHIQRYEQAIKEVKGLVLDVGCGLGYGSGMLCRIHSSVVAFDISDTALLYAKRNYPGPFYVRADAQTFPFKNESFNGVVALEIIEHVDNGIYLLREIYRVLKKRGVLILSTPNVAHLINRLESALFKKDSLVQKQKNPYHKHGYTPKELTRLLESTGFTIEEKRGQILTFPLVHKLPPHLCVNTGRFLPDLSSYIIYKARKTQSRH